MKNRAFRVGIFDSGIGGLSVLAACIKRLPNVRYYYYGDNKRAPYGNRSEAQIRTFTKEALDFFVKIKVDAVVIACNTATAVAVGELRRSYTVPIIGTEPALKPAAANCKNVLVLATTRTAESARLKMLAGRFENCNFTIAACPHLAEAIERYCTLGENFLLSAHLPQGSFDGVVLGCTHYSIFTHLIAKYYHLPVFDGNEGVAKRLETVLLRENLGTKIHALPTKNQNKCFSFSEKFSVKFVGKSRKINKSVFFRTFVLEKAKNK